MSNVLNVTIISTLMQLTSKHPALKHSDCNMPDLTTYTILSLFSLQVELTPQLLSP